MADELTTLMYNEMIYDESEQFMVVWASCVPGRFERDMKRITIMFIPYLQRFKTVSKQTSVRPDSSPLMLS